MVNIIYISQQFAQETYMETCTRLELSVVLNARSPVTDDVQAPLESRTVRLHLHLTALLHYQHACFSLILYSALNGYSCLTSL